MASRRILEDFRLLKDNGDVCTDGVATIYLGGTTTPQNGYSNKDLNASGSSTKSFDAYGVPPDIFVSDALNIKVVITGTGVTAITRDYYSQATTATSILDQPFTDPNADRLIFWDESAGSGGAPNSCQLDTGLSISGTTLSLAANIAAEAALASAADTISYYSGSGVKALTAFTSVARTLVNQTTQALMRTTGLGFTATGDAVATAASAAAGATALGLGTGDSPQFTAINLGNASDTTLTRVSAGVIAVEGNTVAMLNTANVFTQANRQQMAGATNIFQLRDTNTNITTGDQIGAFQFYKADTSGGGSGIAGGLYMYANDATGRNSRFELKAIDTTGAEVTSLKGEHNQVSSLLVHLFVDGAVGAPGVSFTSDPDCGFYRIGANNIGAAANGSLAFDWSDTLFRTSVPMYAIAGSESAPSYAFVAPYTTTGMYRSGNATIGFASGGVLTMDVQANGGVTVYRSASGTAFTVQATDDGALAGPVVALSRVSASPAASDLIGKFQWDGRDSGAATQNYANLQVTITDPTAASEDARMGFETVVAGTVAERLRIEAGLYHASATGGDKGNNTINFGAVYDDNVLLTCFVLEYANTGVVDLSFWDAISPSGRHEGAHRFNEQRHLLDIDAYINHWRTHGHLPGLPSRDEWANHARDKKPVGDMIARLWQTVEMQAVHIAELHARLSALGG